MSLLCFLLCCTMTLTKPQMIADWIPFETPAIETEEPQAEPAMHLWGTCTLTFYCGGSCCCGQWASGYTASGTVATAGRTVACGDLPFGTRLMIEGHEYVVEDRGVSGMWVDIFVNSHAEACQRGMYQADVYIIDRGGEYED